MKSFTFRKMPDDIHKALKVLSVLSDMTMEEYVCKLIKDKAEEVGLPLPLTSKSLPIGKPKRPAKAKKN